MFTLIFTIRDIFAFNKDGLPSDVYGQAIFLDAVLIFLFFIAFLIYVSIT